MEIKLKELSSLFAVCRLPPASPCPEWALTKSELLSLSRTYDELSIVCEQSLVPEGLHAERDWCAFRVEGTLDFSLTGILSSIAGPLAQAKISIFAISTFDTDYVLVKKMEWLRAKKVLEGAGFIFL